MEKGFIEPRAIKGRKEEKDCRDGGAFIEKGEGKNERRKRWYKNDPRRRNASWPVLVLIFFSFSILFWRTAASLSLICRELLAWFTVSNRLDSFLCRRTDYIAYSSKRNREQTRRNLSSLVAFVSPNEHATTMVNSKLRTLWSWTFTFTRLVFQRVNKSDYNYIRI